jgi:quinoprotein glucose dehydrogenase
MRRLRGLRSYTGGGLTVLLAATLPMMTRGVSTPKPKAYTAWHAFGGTPDSMQYSAFTKINKTNVSQLEQVWFYPVIGRADLAFSPLIVGNVMYVAGKGNRVLVALDAATGKEIWTHPTEGTTNERGYAYWESKDGSERRIIFSANDRLQEVDAGTGAQIKSFGEDGFVDLRVGLGRDPNSIRRIQSRSPGQVFENLIIQGSLTGEGYDDPPGWLRAYDVLSGKLVWTFHTIPLPGEYGYDTWPPDAYKFTGGTNTWSNFSIDEKRGIAYFPIGSPTYDFYGGRRKGAGLYGDSILALDARTGKRLWHYQVVHHDLWDLDLCTEPQLLTVRHHGKMVDIVAVATKSGLLFVFNRVTGEPLWPIEERPVGKSDVPGEEAWPTQPFPTVLPPISRQTLSEKDVDPYLDPAEAERVRSVIRASRYEGPYTPMSLNQDQISFPGEYGGTDWGANAGDPTTGVVYVRAENTPLMHRLVERAPQRGLSRGTPEQQGRLLWTRFCDSCHGAGESGVNSLKSPPPERVRRLVRDGNGPMPAVGPADLDEQGMTWLLAYIANPAAGTGAPIPDPGLVMPAGNPGPPPNGEAHRYYLGPAKGGRFGTTKGLDGLPAISPPWSELVAYDLNEGTVKWRVPLGVVPELAAKGITNTGSYHPDRNGLAVTAGGLVFMGTLGDATLRAFDKDTGKVLWEKKMDSNPEGLPSIYEVGGREYVAFFLHSNGEPGPAGPGKPEAQGYYVFALSKNK